uniref:Mediator of RNA polymerase II transcription subunit 15 n=1 Tax=Chelonoidis abingdonii TaxID=106734 RepID=A0A8C0GD62_CHEAB
MDVSGQETDWRSANFRQKLVSQIEEAMRKAGVAPNKSSKDMENHVFMKAKTRVRHFYVFPIVCFGVLGVDKPGSQMHLVF